MNKILDVYAPICRAALGVRWKPGVRFLQRVVGLLVLAGALSVCAADAEMRTWTSAAGSAIEASLVDADRESVVLANSDGSTLRVRLDLLSEEDRAYISTLRPDLQLDEQEEAFSVPASAWLPVFTEGPYAGQFAVYESVTYLFMLDGEGAATLRIKNAAGQVTGPGIPFRPWRSHAIGPNDGSLVPIKAKAGDLTSFTREVESQSDPSLRPVMNPVRIEIKGVLLHDVTFRQTYRFSPGGIHMEYQIEDPAGITYPTRGSEIGFSMDPLEKVDPDMPFEEKRKIMKDWELNIDQVGKGKRMKLTFLEGIDSKPGSIERAQIIGPWGTRMVEIRFREPPGRLGIYKSFPLYRGFSLGTSGHWELMDSMAIEISVK